MLPSLLSKNQIQEIKEGLKGITPGEPNLQNISSCFDVCFLHPKVLSGIVHIINYPFISVGIQFRPNPPGRGTSKLHVAYGGVPPYDGTYYACNVIWMIDEFTMQNGPTRAVPTSHRWGRIPEEMMSDPRKSFPGEVYWVGPAGSAVVFNGHLWHSTTRNQSERNRIAIVTAWHRHGTKTAPRASQWGVLNEYAKNRLSPSAKYLFP